MYKTVTALRYYGPKDLRLEQISPQPCGPDEVRLQIAYCGICGSDIHEYLGNPIFPPKPGEQHPWTGAQLPVTLGHEMSGTIIEVGANVHHLKVGTNVAVNPSLDDRHYGLAPCTPCTLGKRNICKRWASYGMSAQGGGFASEIVVHALNCIALPPGLSLREGALLEPLAVAWHCIRVAEFQKGQTALVLGAGPIGLAILMLLRVWGARTVVVSEVTALRKRLAGEFGADLVVDPTGSGDGVDAILSGVHETVDSDGVDVAFDTTGQQTTLDTAIASTRAGGTVFNVAVHERPLQVNLNDLACMEKTLTGGICYAMEDFEGVMQALADGKLHPEKMITSMIPLEQVIDQGMAELARNKASHVKILVRANLGHRVARL